MHTTKAISLSDFRFLVNGHAGTLADIFPGFDVSDRIGVVVNQPAGTVGVGGLLLAAATCFYDAYRAELGNEPDKLRLYPDYYIFHVGQIQGNHAQLDIWPPHREVIVENDPEQILEAIIDRGITRLLIEDKPSAPATFLRETLSSARHRLKTVLAYSASGNTTNANLHSAHPQVVEDYVLKTLSDSQVATGLSPAQYEALLAARRQLAKDGYVQESYRTVDLASAWGMLSNDGKISPATQRYLDLSYTGAGVVIG